MSSDSWGDRESNVDSQTTVTLNGQVTTSGENMYINTPLLYYL